MPNISTRRWPLLIGISLGALIVACWGIAQLDSYLALRLEKQPRLLSCELIRPGMGREEVAVALASVGPYEEEVVSSPGPARTYIYFNDPIARVGTGTVVLIFTDDVLSSVGRRTGLGDPLEMPDCNE